MENRPGIKVSVGREIAKKLCSTNTKELLVLRLLEFHFIFSMQSSGVANHKLFKAIIVLKLSTFYQKGTNTLLKDY